MKRALPVMSALLLTLLCSIPAGASDASEEGDLLAQLRQEFVAAINARDMDKALTYVATDARMFVNGIPALAGHEAIRQMGQMMFMGSSVRLSMETVHREVSGHLAYEAGSFTMTFTGEAANNEPQQGKFIDVWKKGDDGKWRIVAHCPSMNSMGM